MSNTPKIVAPFHGPRLKVGRARRHLKELRQRIYQYATEHPAEVAESLLPNGAPRFSLKTPEEPVPDEISLIVGDVAHNLRSSLDLMMCDIMRLKKKSTDKIKFPFAATEKDLNKLLDGELKRAGPEVCSLIKNFKPYKGGNRALRALHDLDISDKHDIVLPMSRQTLYALTVMRVTLNGKTTILRHAGSYEQLPAPEKVDPASLNIEMILPSNYADISIVFAAGVPFAGEPALKILESTSDLINRIIQAFETLCFGGKPDP